MPLTDATRFQSRTATWTLHPSFPARCRRRVPQWDLSHPLCASVWRSFECEKRRMRSQLRSRLPINGSGFVEGGESFVCVPSHFLLSEHGDGSIVTSGMEFSFSGGRGGEGPQLFQLNLLITKNGIFPATQRCTGCGARCLDRATEKLPGSARSDLFDVSMDSLRRVAHKSREPRSRLGETLRFRGEAYLQLPRIPAAVRFHYLSGSGSDGWGRT